MRDRNKAIARRLYEIMSTGNIALLDDCMATDIVDHEEFPGLPPGREGFKEFVRILRNAFPDLSITLEDLVTEQDRVVARITMTGTHQGDFLGMPATDKRFNVQAIDILHIQNGQVVEHWGVTDQLTMMQQLGMIPTPSEASR